MTCAPTDAQVEAALAPFARMADLFDAPPNDLPDAATLGVVVTPDREGRATVGDLRRARAAYDAADDGWRPIEEAPKDGTRVLLYFPETEGLPAAIAICLWQDEMWVDQFDLDLISPAQPTHFRPLPPPPRSEP